MRLPAAPARSRFVRLTAAVLVGASLAPLAACGPRPAERPVAKAPEWKPESQTKCGVAKSQARPLIVEWPAAERALLEGKMKRGIVAVHYEGCELEVLRQCQVTGKYAYTSVTRKDDHVSIRNEEELFTAMPGYAVKLESTLSSRGRLDVEMAIVGTFDAELPKGASLEGDCGRATHLITSLTAGAFEFSAGGAEIIGGGLGVAGGGKTQAQRAERELLSRDGDRAACQTRPGDAVPPPGCGALLRIEVTPTNKAELLAIRTSPPPGTPPPTSTTEAPRGAIYGSAPPTTYRMQVDYGPQVPAWRRSLEVTGYTIGSLGVLTGLSTGLVLLIQRSNLSDKCPDGKCSPARQKDVDSYHTVATITNWGMGLGLGFLALGITISATNPKANAQPGVTVQTAIGPGSLGLTGSF
jgi:hypothetical protein